jgi:tetratricopeptide (TPR) repeat protein
MDNLINSYEKAKNKKKKEEERENLLIKIFEIFGVNEKKIREDKKYLEEYDKKLRKKMGPKKPPKNEEIEEIIENFKLCIFGRMEKAGWRSKYFAYGPEIVEYFKKRGIDKDEWQRNLLSEGCYNSAYKSFLKNKFDEAIEEYKRALWHKSDNTSALNGLGICFLRIQKYDEAIEVFKLALKLEPNTIAYFLNLAGAYKGKNMFDEALKIYKKALEIDPDVPDIRFAMGTLIAERGNEEEGFGEMLKASAKKPEILENISKNFSRQKGDQIIDGAGTHYALGIEYLEKNQLLGLATKEFKKALEINPDHYGAHFNLGKIYLDKGRLKEAKSEFENALLIKPDSTEVQNSLVDVLRKLKLTLSEKKTRILKLIGKGDELKDLIKKISLDKYELQKYIRELKIDGYLVEVADTVKLTQIGKILVKMDLDL